MRILGAAAISASIFFEAREDPSRRLLFEQVERVFQRAAHVGPVVLDVIREVRNGAPGVHVELTKLEATNSGRRRRRLAKTEQNLEQRRPTSIARG